VLLKAHGAAKVAAFFMKIARSRTVLTIVFLGLGFVLFTLAAVHAIKVWGTPIAALMFVAALVASWFALRFGFLGTLAYLLMGVASLLKARNALRTMAMQRREN
jgi:hypothetical protein